MHRQATMYWMLYFKESDSVVSTQFKNGKSRETKNPWISWQLYSAWKKSMVPPNEWNNEDQAYTWEQSL